MFPEDLRYTVTHGWLRSGNGTTVRVGLTDFAAGSLGDIVYVSLPQVGEEVAQGDHCVGVESTQSVAELHAPVAGVVTSVNPVLESAPETVNTDPYGDGWLFEIDMSAPEQLDALLDAAGYGALVSEG